MIQNYHQYCVIDIETPNHNNDRISSIAYAVVRDGRITESGHTLVNPETYFDDFNIQLTGIDEDMVLDAPTFPDVWAGLSDLLCRSVVVAHNAPFDLGVLRKCLSAYDIQTPELWYLCTRSSSRQMMPTLPDHKLNTICDYLEIPLNHHQADSDAHACAIILLTLLHSSQFQPDRFISRFSMSTQVDANKSRRTREPSATTKALHDLSLIVEAITTDDQLTEGEVHYLTQWMMGNQELSGNYPYDRIFSLLSEILADGVLEQSELNQMLSLLKSTVDPVQEQSCGASITDIAGKNICLTGEFDRAPRAQIDNELAGLGAVVQKNVNRRTQIVLVGGQGSEAWCAGNYGTKVKKALELQSKGFDIQIVREKDFFSDVLGKGASV